MYTCRLVRKGEFAAYLRFLPELEEGGPASLGTTEKRVPARLKGQERHANHLVFNLILLVEIIDLNVFKYLCIQPRERIISVAVV